MEGLGARCGHPAPLRLPHTLERPQTAPAWRAGCPHRAPNPGARPRNRTPMPVRPKAPRASSRRQHASSACSRPAARRIAKIAHMRLTAAKRMEGLGARCGHPAPLRLPYTLERPHTAPAWRAGCPHRAPTPGARPRNRTPMPVRPKARNQTSSGTTVPCQGKIRGQGLFPAAKSILADASAILASCLRP